MKDIQMPITIEFIEAVEFSLGTLVNFTHEIARCPEYKFDSSVGRVLRTQNERSIQKIAMLKDWVIRAKELIKT